MHQSILRFEHEFVFPPQMYIAFLRYTMCRYTQQFGFGPKPGSGTSGFHKQNFHLGPPSWVEWLLPFPGGETGPPDTMAEFYSDPVTKPSIHNGNEPFKIFKSMLIVEVAEKVIPKFRVMKAHPISDSKFHALASFSASSCLKARTSRLSNKSTGRFLPSRHSQPCP